MKVHLQNTEIYEKNTVPDCGEPESGEKKFIFQAVPSQTSLLCSLKLPTETR